MDYMITWKHRTDYGSRGCGTKRLSKEEAERLAAELNQDYPHIEHRAIPAFDRPKLHHYPTHD